MVMSDVKTESAVKYSTQQKALLFGPIFPSLLKLAAPNIISFFIMSCVAIAEMWFVGQLGTPALAGFAIMFPMVMLMQMLSAGSVGGVIAATTARALGSGDNSRANRIVWFATALAIAASILFFVIFKFFGASIAIAIGAEGESLTEAMSYSSVVFSGIITTWLFNIFSSLLRGAGDMNTPARAMILAAGVQVFFSGALSLGWFGFPALGIAGIGWGLVIAMTVGAIIVFLRLFSGRSGIRFTRKNLVWDSGIAKEIGRVGGMAATNPFLSVSTVVLLTGLVSQFGEAAIAGFGIGARLEFILIPIVFGFGAAMISLVGTNIGAGKIDRAQRIGWTGGSISALICGVIGCFVALFPESWAGVFTNDPVVFEAAASYLKIVGPSYIFFGLGLSLYFASQGAHAVFWPVLASVGRLAVAIGVGSFAVKTLSSDYETLLFFVAASLVVYGCIPALSLALGAWRRANQ